MLETLRGGAYAFTTLPPESNGVWHLMPPPILPILKSCRKGRRTDRLMVIVKGYEFSARGSSAELDVAERRSSSSAARAAGMSASGRLMKPRDFQREARAAS